MKVFSSRDNNGVRFMAQKSQMTIRNLLTHTSGLMARNHLSAESLPVSISSWVFKGIGFGLGYSVLIDKVASQVLAGSLENLAGTVNIIHVSR
jgi:hypothetical protein